MTRAQQQLRRQREDARRLATFKKAVRYFRPRKAERGQVVFLRAADGVKAKAGQRVPPGFRGRVFALYVGPRGAVRPVKERGQGRRPPKPVTIRTLDPGRMVGRRREKEEVRKVVTARQERMSGIITVVNTGPGGVDWHRDFEPKLARRLVAAVRQQRDRWNFNVRVAAVVRLEDGEVRVLTSLQGTSAAALFRLMPRQAVDPGALVRTFIRRKLYADFAEQLKQEGAVSSGSAAFVAKLKFNQGRPRGEWRDGRGARWDKRNLPVVEIVRLDAEILSVSVQ